MMSAPASRKRRWMSAMTSGRVRLRMSPLPLRSLGWSAKRSPRKSASVQLELLQGGAHGAVDDDDALLEECFERMHGKVELRPRRRGVEREGEDANNISIYPDASMNKSAPPLPCLEIWKGVLEAIRKMSRGHVMRRIWAESRRERRAYPQRSVRSEQRRARPKFAITRRAEAFLPWGFVAHSLRTAEGMLLARLLAPRQKFFRRGPCSFFG